jgi:hypothetical protein
MWMYVDLVAWYNAKALEYGNNASNSQFCNFEFLAKNQGKT